MFFGLYAAGEKFFRAEKSLTIQVPLQYAVKVSVVKNEIQHYSLSLDSITLF